MKDYEAMLKHLMELGFNLTGEPNKHFGYQITAEITDERGARYSYCTKNETKEACMSKLYSRIIEKERNRGEQIERDLEMYRLQEIWQFAGDWHAGERATDQEAASCAREVISLRTCKHVTENSMIYNRDRRLKAENRLKGIREAVRAIDNGYRDTEDMLTSIVKIVDGYFDES